VKRNREHQKCGCCSTCHTNGIKSAAWFAGTWDKQITKTKYMFQDIILCKFNVISKRQLRKKPITSSTGA